MNTGVGRFMSRDTWAGDDNRPLSLHKWMYAEGNPINFTDPSGHCLPITDDPSDDAAACWVVLNRIERKYPSVDLRFALEAIWPKGLTWKFSELDVLEKGLKRLDEEMSTALGGFNSVFIGKGSLLIYKGTKSTINPDYCAQSLVFVITFFDIKKCGEQGVVHELAHSWDGLTAFKLSSDFMNYVGTHHYVTWTSILPDIGYCVGPEIPPSYLGGNPTNSREDFAESAEEYLYKPGRRIRETEKRWEFIETLFNTGMPPNP